MDDSQSVWKLNSNAPRMINKNGCMKCRFNYPKMFNEITSLADDEKPSYRQQVGDYLATIQKKSHSVQRLDIHLPGQFRIANFDLAQEDLADTGQKGSTLEAYFRHNRGQTEENILNGYSQDVIYHYYWQIPEYFKWDRKSSEWIQRSRRLRFIGRIHNVNFISQSELYHLRLLLYHVQNATSFEDMLTVDGITYASCKQVCLVRGLTCDDQQWIAGLRESAM